MEQESPPEGIESAARPVIGVLLQAELPDRTPSDDEFDLSPPIPVVHVGLDALRSGASIDSAERVGWRQLVRQGGEAVALSEVILDPSGVPQVTQLNFGPLVESISAALARPGRSPDVFDGEVRFLQIPALYTLALWYEGPKENFVVPLSPAPKTLDASREYPVEQFLEIMHRMARDANPDGPALA